MEHFCPDPEELNDLSREELLEHCKQMKDSRDRVFAIVSHDLRSPFSGLLGLSEILSGGTAGVDRQHLDEYLSTMHDSLTNTYRLLENLFEWGQIERGKYDRTIELIPLEFIIVDVLEPLSAMISRKGIHIVREYDPEQTISTNSRMFEFVLRNLISNAVKFSQRGSSVRIGCRVSGNETSVYVSDDGVGMADENIAKLFSTDSYRKTHGTEGETGTGIGLLASSRFAGAFAARIEVESSPGSGSTFSVILPERPV